MSIAEDTGSGAFTGDAPEGDRLGNRVAAQTVLAMHAACDFTGRIEALDRLAALVDHASLLVELQATHVVVDGGGDFDSVERRRIDLDLGIDARTIEVGIFASVGVLVVLRDRGFKILGINACVFGQFSQRLAFLGKAQFKGCAGLLDALANLVVEDFKSRAARLTKTAPAPRTVSEMITGEPTSSVGLS